MAAIGRSHAVESSRLAAKSIDAGLIHYALFLRVIICLSVVRVGSARPFADQLVTEAPPVMAPSNCGEGRVYDAEADACCRTCASGFGVALPCTGTGIGNDTVCTPCIDGATYSSAVSQEETCQPCSHCPANAQAVHRCNVTHNTKCECVEGFWYDPEKKTCAVCFPCQPGFEATRPCAPYQNTHCRPCARGYYSDSYGYATKCRLCSLCKPGQLVRTPCSSVRDTDCVDAKALLSGIGGTDEPMISSVNLFPVYCAVPAVVLVSLIFFVIFKRWKQFPCNRSPPSKAAAAFNPREPMAASTLTSIVRSQQRHICPPSGHNKRHSGGVDGNSAGCRKELKPMLLTGDGPVQCLPNDVLEQLERHLNGSDGREPGDWIALAKQLGYGDPRIKTILKESAATRVSPAKQLLQEWSYGSHATIRLLADALDKIGRSDLASLLRRDIDLSSKMNNNKMIVSGPVHFV